MNCPHCKKELPGNYATGWCPFCGRDLHIESLETRGTTEIYNHPSSFNWLLFCAVLFVPPVLAFMSMTFSMELLGELMAVPLIFSGLICGLVCARMIMNRSDLYGFHRGVAHFFLALALCALSYFLSFMGCGCGVALNHRV